MAFQVVLAPASDLDWDSKWTDAHEIRRNELIAKSMWDWGHKRCPLTPERIAVFMQFVPDIALDTQLRNDMGRIAPQHGHIDGSTIRYMFTLQTTLSGVRSGQQIIYERADIKDYCDAEALLKRAGYVIPKWFTLKWYSVSIRPKRVRKIPERFVPFTV